MRTSVSGPRFWTGASAFPKANLLIPYGLLKLEGQEFEDKYVARLEKHGVMEIQSELTVLAHWSRHGHPTLALMCFEKDRATCHRSIFGRWWHEKTGIEVVEFDPTIHIAAEGAA